MTVGVPLIKWGDTLYVAGPMSWKPFFNEPAFIAARRWLEGQGFKALLPTDIQAGSDFHNYPTGNPAAYKHDHPWFSLPDILRDDLELVHRAQGVFLLPEWENSKGARTEVTYAIAIGKPCFERNDIFLHYVPAEVLNERMGRPNVKIGDAPEPKIDRDSVTIAAPKGAAILRNAAGHALGQFGRAKDPKVRKQQPIAEGVLDYFPDAIAAVANVSFIGNEQHNPGEPLHWAREKSTDEDSACVRHILERNEVWDTDGCLHRAKQAWRALAGLQKFLETQTVNTADAGAWIDWPEAKSAIQT